MNSRALAVVGLVVGGAVVVTMVGGTVLIAFAAASQRGMLASGTRYPLSIVKHMSDAQQRMAMLIVALARAKGYSAAVAGALIANAWAESRLDPNAAGDVDARGIPHAYGLFQLNDASPRALGYGMTAAARKDPSVNTMAILRAMDGAPGEAVRAAESEGASIADLAALVSRDVERPADEQGEMIRRRTYATQLFGAAATVPGAQVDYVS